MKVKYRCELCEFLLFSTVLFNKHFRGNWNYTLRFGLYKIESSHPQNGDIFAIHNCSSHWQTILENVANALLKRLQTWIILSSLFIWMMKSKVVYDHLLQWHRIGGHHWPHMKQIWWRYRRERNFNCCWLIVCIHNCNKTLASLRMKRRCAYKLTTFV